jgi:hypothetical protein
MKPTRPSGLVVLVLVCFAHYSSAQESIQTVTPPLLPQAAHDSLATAPAPELSNLVSNCDWTHRITADVGVGCCWAHGGGFASGPLLGTSGSVGLWGQGVGAGISWSEFSTTTKTSEWNSSHRP